MTAFARPSESLRVCVLRSLLNRYVHELQCEPPHIQPYDVHLELLCAYTGRFKPHELHVRGLLVRPVICLVIVSGIPLCPAP